MENKYYYKDGTTSTKRDLYKVLHRTAGPAIEYTDGEKHWYIDNRYHRIGGPAVEYVSGSKCWWVDGKLHRIDGPAVEYSAGVKCWYVDDERYDEKDFNKLMKEVKELPKVLRLIDPREWVRKL